MTSMNYSVQIFDHFSSSSFLDGEEYKGGLVIVFEDIKVIEIYNKDTTNDLRSFRWISIDDSDSIVQYKTLYQTEIDYIISQMNESIKKHRKVS